MRYQAPLSPGYHQDLNESGVAYDLYIPEPVNSSQQKDNEVSSYRLLLVLPGWKFDKSRWIKETDLKRYAREHSMILVLPQMNTSIYASAYFPETRMKWNPTPGLQYINEKLIPGLREKYGFFLPGKQNYILGLSTGGRGVALIALSNPELFKAGASFSGDFDQSVMPTDKLMAAVYGPFEKFSRRWRETDNPVHAASKLQTPLYLSHGTADHIVPPDQTQRFYDAIQKSRSENGQQAASNQDQAVELKMVPGAGHDFSFWNQQLGPAFAFFKKYFHE
ncbi:MAG: prolyl oligopeptidase family serine peptidase [Leptospiraceae bacterium]|nr:prolyl oligopeptidase family serine peptidase [Leptospiraceae bacterium]